MTDDWPAHDKRTSLAQVIPGWEGRYTPETIEKVARGVAAEQERLSGSQFLVVLRRYELCYDGIMEWIEIVSGHKDVESATAAAQIVGAQRLVEMGRELDPGRSWKHGTPTGRMIAPWPKIAPMLDGKRLPVFSDRLWDGVGWNAAEVGVAVIPTDPENPINLALIEAIDMTWETVCWFEDVVDKAG